MSIVLKTVITYIFLFLRTVSCQNFVSPCPRLLTYLPSEATANSWSAEIILRTDAELSGIYLRLIFDQSPSDVASDFGDVVQRESNEYLIRKPGHRLLVGTDLKLKLTVRYDPAEAIPKLIGFRLNAKSVCPEEAASPPLAKGLISPCPNIFSYQNIDKGAGKWYGQILLNVKSPLREWTLTVVLDRTSLQLGGWRGSLRTQDNVEYQLSKPGVTLLPGVFPVKFFIKYRPTGHIPKLSEIQLNKVNICPEDSIIVNPIPDSITIGIGTSPAVSQPSSGGEGECGRTATRAVVPLITHGHKTAPGQHPWHAALYHNKNVELTYVCGATLISKSCVLTAAHCATKQTTGAPLNPSYLVVVVGKYFLDREVTEGIQDIMVQKVLVHPNYDKSVFRNDIAILKLTTSASITDNVRPICLWTEPKELSAVVGLQGTVVGWGYTENGRPSDQLLKTQMPIVDRITCILSKPEFFGKFTNEMTLCAGFRNGSSACNGDSGGGLSLPKTQNGETVWYLRGIVSTAVNLQNLDICDTSNYIIFTDVAQYSDWIKSNMK